MVMWRAKDCPRCGGDIFIDIDEQGWFNHCLQCGYVGQRLHHICTHCGDKMHLDTVTQLFYCSHCGHNSERPQKTEITDTG